MEILVGKGYFSGGKSGGEIYANWLELFTEKFTVKLSHLNKFH